MYRKDNIDVQGSPMEVLVYEPEGDGPFPGIVVAQHLPVAHAGLETDPFTLDIGDKLVAAGYAVIIPFIFHWWPKGEELAVKRDNWRDDWNIADMAATYDYFAALPSVDEKRIGVMGHCWGGRVAWLAATQNPNYAAAAVFYGGRIKLGLGPESTPPIEMADQIPCPVLGIFGNDDQNPSPDDVADLDAALNAVNVPHEFHQYDGAGHGFQDFVNEERFRKDQTEDAWSKLFAFMDKNLK